MQPSQLEQLAKDRQAYLLADRRHRRLTGHGSGRLVHLTRRSLQKTGLGLIRVGVRLAGPELSPNRPQSGGVGALESSA